MAEPPAMSGASGGRLMIRATLHAHTAGDVPRLTPTLDTLDEHRAGALIHFFEEAVALSGRLLGVNPFDQPGVEAYKQEMFRLLGRP